MSWIFKTTQRIAQNFHWPKMKVDVANYVRRCETCLQQKVEQRAPAAITQPRRMDQQWKVFYKDFMAPFPVSSKRNRFILVVSDLFTQYILLFPLRSANAVTVTRYIEEDVFLIYGVPDSIICDNGKQYFSKKFREMVRNYKFIVSLTPLYHPQSNPIERSTVC